MTTLIYNTCDSDVWVSIKSTESSSQTSQIKHSLTAYSKGEIPVENNPSAGTGSLKVWDDSNNLILDTIIPTNIAGPIKLVKENHSVVAEYLGQRFVTKSANNFLSWIILICILLAIAIIIYFLLKRRDI